MTEARPVQDLREFLRELNPRARALLLAEIERGQLRGATFPGADLVLRELRPVLRTAREQPERLDSPVRLFFRPLDPFIVDGRFDFPVCGRVHRSALAPLWTWICRDLVPEPSRAYSDGVAAALLTENHAYANDLATAFQDLVAGAMQDLLESHKGEREQRRLAAQIGIPRALDELRLVQHLLGERDEIARVFAQLPSVITELADGQFAHVLKVVSARRESPPLVLSSLVLVRNQLRLFWQLVRLAVSSAESDVAARVEKAPLAPAAAIVLADLRCMNEELRVAFRENRLPAALGIVRAIQDAVRALRTELDFSVDCSLAREFGALRADVSDLLAAEIKTTPGLLRRILRISARQGGEPLLKVDPAEVSEAESRIELVAACRDSAGELALNQLAPRIHAELQNVLDNATQRLLENLRKARGLERDHAEVHLAAGLRLAAKLFGPEHATQLAKAAALAGLNRTAAIG